jgi:hypothetical protein
MDRTRCVRIWLVAWGLVVFGASSLAQGVPWEIYEDEPISSSVCDVVNAANAELVVLADTGQFVIVTGDDVTLEDTLVDFDGFVYLETGIPGLLDAVGYIGFAEDGDGYRTLWWTSLTGRVVSVDGFTGEPTETDLFPSDFYGVPCDACDYWDDPLACWDPSVDDDSDDYIDEPITFNLCGLNAQVGAALTAVGLGFMGLTRRWAT